MASTQMKDALYYPYIHIRGDINWLKATLLTFPHLMRMVPQGFEVNDSEAVRSFAEATGAGDRRLVGQVDLTGPAIATAQLRLANCLEADFERDPDAFRQRFSREAALRDYPGNGDSIFQIHRAKFLDLPAMSGDLSLRAFLMDNGLMWFPSQPNRRGTWRGVHPVLGEAIMATIACAVANAWGLDIVTNEGALHAALATADADAVYDSVILQRSSAAPSEQEVIDDISQLVVMNHFDVGRLSVEAIASMSRDGETLYEFKQAVAAIAGRIPPMTEPAAREQALREAADEVMGEWNDRKLSMSRVARDFFGMGMLDSSEPAMKKVLEAVAATAGGTLAVTVLGVLPGLALGLLTHGARVVNRHWDAQRTSPYRYLSKLIDRGATLTVAPPPPVRKAAGSA